MPPARNEDTHNWVQPQEILTSVIVPLLPSLLPWIPSLRTGSLPMTHPRAPKLIDLAGGCGKPGRLRQNLGPNAPYAIRDFVRQRIADHSLLCVLTCG